MDTFETRSHIGTIRENAPGEFNEIRKYGQS